MIPLDAHTDASTSRIPLFFLVLSAQVRIILYVRVALHLVLYLTPRFHSPPSPVTFSSF